MNVGSNQKDTKNNSSQIAQTYPIDFNNKVEYYSSKWGERKCLGQLKLKQLNN